MAEAYIVAGVRTAGGRKGGRLRDWHPADLGAVILNEIVARSGIDGAAVDDVIFGCVSQVGAQAGNIARGSILGSRRCIFHVSGASSQPQTPVQTSVFFKGFVKSVKKTTIFGRQNR